MWNLFLLLYRSNGVFTLRHQRSPPPSMPLIIGFKQLIKGREMCAVFFYLRKAFNSVPYRSLFDKLRFLGFSGHMLKWIYSYLLEREQYGVVSSHQKSQFYQGSVQGPLLFLIYTYDSTNEALEPNTHITLYADDMILYRVALLTTTQRKQMWIPSLIGSPEIT